MASVGNFKKHTMKKLIVWFVPKNKKIYSNQFHIEAVNNTDAIEQCKKHCEFEIKIMGISCFNGTNFVNNKIY
jgi:hypothetical protein